MNTHFWNTTWFRVTIGTLSSIVFLILAAHDVPLSDVGQALARVNYGWILLCVVGMLVQSWLRAVRWSILYYPEQKGLRIAQMFGIVQIGQMLNVVVPWRVGEIARIYLMGEIEKRSKTQTLATLGVEKFFDTLMLLLILLIIPPFMTLPNWLEGPRQGLVVTAVILFVGLVVLLVARNWLIKLLMGVYAPWSKRSLGEILKLALSSLDVLKRWDLHLLIQLLSIIMWGIGILINYLVYLSMDLQLPWISAFLLMAVLLVGNIVPSSPGKIGVFQALCIATLALFGVDKTIGLTYGILLYLISYGTPVVVGILALWWGGVNLQRITASQGEAAQ